MSPLKKVFLGHPDHVYQFPCFYHKLKYPGAKTPIINVFKVNNKNTGIKSTHLVLVTLLLPLTVNFEQTEPAVRRCFQNGVLKNFAIFTRKYMWFKVALQVCNFIRKSLQHSCFPVKIVKFLRIVFYTTPPVAASWTQLEKKLSKWILVRMTIFLTAQGQAFLGSPHKFVASVFH